MPAYSSIAASVRARAAGSIAPVVPMPAPRRVPRDSPATRSPSAPRISSRVEFVPIENSARITGGPFAREREPTRMARTAPAFLFDLDGTLVDSVYQHVAAWHVALRSCGIPLSVWRIHRKIGMSGGLFVRGLMRELGRELSPDVALELRRRHAEAYAARFDGVVALPGARELLATLTAWAWRGPSRPAARARSRAVRWRCSTSRTASRS